MKVSGLMKNRIHIVVLGCCLLLAGGIVSGVACGAAFAQGRPGGGPGGGGMGGRPTFGEPGSGFPGGGPLNRGGYPTSPGGVNGGSSRRPDGGANGGARGLQLGPPGRWWDDKGFAKTLGLSKDQQKKMDAVFNANKGSILESYKALQKEESRLQAIAREKTLDEAKIFAGIDSVAQARAGLEKANAHMLLLIRQEMDADQNARMDRYRDQASDE
jgi:Spy/CpxP family protein refolding chaperone